MINFYLLMTCIKLLWMEMGIQQKGRHPAQEKYIKQFILKTDQLNKFYMQVMNRALDHRKMITFQLIQYLNSCLTLSKLLKKMKLKGRKHFLCLLLKAV